MKNDSREELFVFGASGHAKVIVDIIEQQGIYRVGFILDDNPELWDREFYGYRVAGGRDVLLSRGKNSGLSRGIVAIGSNRARASVAGWLVQNGFQLASVIHPGAAISRGVSIAAGTVVMAGAVINADTTIGDNVIINTGATIDHDCTVGNCVHIAPGATLCGTVTVGDGTFICAGAIVIPNLHIGASVVVGAGATVVRNVPDNVMVVGTPARQIHKR
jgi:sugar O-acyltransferase (sialic acid O-acetyltransferase NeuD family)